MTVNVDLTLNPFGVVSNHNKISQTLNRVDRLNTRASNISTNKLQSFRRIKFSKANKPNLKVLLVAVQSSEATVAPLLSLQVKKSKKHKLCINNDGVRSGQMI